MIFTGAGLEAVGEILESDSGEETKKLEEAVEAESIMDEDVEKETESPDDDDDKKQLKIKVEKVDIKEEGFIGEDEDAEYVEQDGCDEDDDDDKEREENEGGNQDYEALDLLYEDDDKLLDDELLYDEGVCFYHFKLVFIFFHTVLFSLAG